MGYYFDDSVSNREKRATGRRRIGERLRALRKARKDRQKDIAEICGVSAAQISRVESGKSDLDASAVMVLADRYGVAAETFFHEFGSLATDFVRRLLRSVHMESEEARFLRYSDYMLKQAIQSENEEMLFKYMLALMTVCGESRLSNDKVLSTLRKSYDTDLQTLMDELGVPK